MSVIGIGVDLIECARIQHSIDRFGDRFLHRVFTDSEIEYSMSMKFPERHLAARFAAKEAVRSEEHTSELQSQSNLVCRLLLAKKKMAVGLGRLEVDCLLLVRRRLAIV